jgi:transcriptional regulator with XRE-family HTH domain
MLVLYRAANNIGVRDLAPEIGTSAATLSRIERGYLPDVETFMKIQHWLLAGRR